MGGQDWQNNQSQEFHNQSQDFQQFDYGNYGQQQHQETDASNPYLAPNAPNPYTGSMFVPDPSPGPQDYKAVHGSSEWEDEPPLLEGLGQHHPPHLLQLKQQLHWHNSSSLKHNNSSTSSINNNNSSSICKYNSSSCSCKYNSSNSSCKYNSSSIQRNISFQQFRYLKHC